ncbi:GNAT family N-acetyltransferase [Flavobacterium sp. MC2016-06]|uniref:GNAT family N-acetyltransferase n=1 Tax=Flavobacterium sp. MC2016-06 TaxID=2676308 RepID=UPI0012BA9101|nr:GNAT family N-acetyltransferase [Flavobacterium sp. MC2016-06]MBU3860275.1 GNAT family N-acetyltransferase [Flavobacterium sp. MC2016-06]
MNLNFRKAVLQESDSIWAILSQAIVRRKQDGSQQWQDGYPNLEVVKKDIEKGSGYVLTDNDIIIGYASIVFNDEPAYDELVGTWLTNGDFAVLHRLAISEDYLGKGLAKKILLYTEELALQNNIFSIKVDTNFDNIPMLKIFEKLDYVYCGEVEFRGGKRKAFEKKLS